VAAKSLLVAKSRGRSSELAAADIDQRQEAGETGPGALLGAQLRAFHGYLKQIDLLAGRNGFPLGIPCSITMASSSTPGECAASFRWPS
jgi:hypothetical protein